MPFSFDREMAAKELLISTRTLDRYVKSWKIRARKVGKKVYLNDADISAIKSYLEWDIESAQAYDDRTVITETIVEKKRAKNGYENGSEWELLFYPDSTSDESTFRRTSIVDYKDLFEDAQRRIAEKDRVIQELSFRVGKSEAELKNSISLIEYKKTSLLLESAKTKSESDEKSHKEAIDSLSKNLAREKNVSLILTVAVALLLIATVLIWFYSL